MSSISSKYVVVDKFMPPEVEGEFKVAQVQGDEVYKGVIVELPEVPVHLSNQQLKVGDVILFAPHSPDTFLVEGKRFVRVEDLLKVL